MRSELPRLVLRDNVVFQDRDGLLVNLETGQVLELNGSAVCMVKAMREDDPLAALSAMFPDVERNRLVRDFEALAASMRALALLE